MYSEETNGKSHKNRLCKEKVTPSGKAVKKSITNGFPRSILSL
jgi:hypothetical protein